MNETEIQPFNNVDIAPIKLFAHVSWSLAAVIGIPANAFVLFAIAYFRDMRTISNVYIFNIAVADLVFLSGIPIFVFGQTSDGDWQLGSFMCKCFISGNAISQFSSAVFIAILSFDRFLAVCRPISSSIWRTTQAAFGLSISAWVMVTLEMTPLFLFVKLITHRGDNGTAKRTCMLFVGSEEILDNSKLSDQQLNEVERSMLMSRRFFMSYTFALSYLIPLIAVWFFYVKIIIKMFKRKRQAYIRRTVSRRRTTKVTLLGLAIVVSYTICLLPFWVVQWFIEFNVLKESPFLLISFSHFAFALQYINSAFNPFLYVFFSDSFKKNVSKLLLASKHDKQSILKTSSAAPTDTSKMLQPPNSQRPSVINDPPSTSLPRLSVF